MAASSRYQNLLMATKQAFKPNTICSAESCDCINTAVINSKCKLLAYGKKNVSEWMLQGPTTYTDLMQQLSYGAYANCTFNRFCTVKLIPMFKHLFPHKLKGRSFQRSLHIALYISPNIPIISRKCQLNVS